MVMRAGFGYREAPESVPAFANWFERCKATARKHGLAALSQMEDQKLTEPPKPAETVRERD
jgi:hypothetical protein